MVVYHCSQGRYSVSTLRCNNTRVAALGVVFCHNVIVIFSKWPNPWFRLVINPEAKFVSEPKRKEKRENLAQFQPLTRGGKPFPHYKPQFGNRGPVWGKPYNRCLPPSRPPCFTSHTLADTLLAPSESSFNYSYWFPSSPGRILTLPKEKAAWYFGYIELELFFLFQLLSFRLERVVGVYSFSKYPQFIFALLG